MRILVIGSGAREHALALGLKNDPATTSLHVAPGKRREEGSLGTIPPNREARFPLLLAMGSPNAVDCIVTWTDASGHVRETRATVRT